jgi:rhodanese-related sulfurtransferase
MVTAATMGIDDVLETARLGIRRVNPVDVQRLQAEGAFVVDIRPERTRRREGHLPGAVVMERNILEWRLDPSSAVAMAHGPRRDQLVVIVCNEGFASSLAARDLRQIGFLRAADLVGGFRAYAAAGLPVDRHPSRVVD